MTYGKLIVSVLVIATIIFDIVYVINYGNPFLCKYPSGAEVFAAFSLVSFGTLIGVGFIALIIKYWDKPIIKSKNEKEKS